MPSAPGANPVVGRPTGVGVPVPVGVAEELGEELGVIVAQNSFLMVFVSSVTEPTCASSCHCTVAPVSALMDKCAKMCPTKWEFVHRVAELGTTQKTRQNRAPWMRRTSLSDAVISVALL